MQIASRIENLALVNRKMEQLKAAHKIGEALFSRMLSAVNESFTNAVRHGNQDDTSKIVVFEHQVLPGRKCVFAISDEGKGFNWQEHADLPEDPEQEGGRGLFIVDQLSDNCVFNKKGNRIELHFTL